MMFFLIPSVPPQDMLTGNENEQVFLIRYSFMINVNKNIFTLCRQLDLQFLLCFPGSSFFRICNYGNFSDMGFILHSLNFILVALKNISSNMISAATSLSLTSTSRIRNTHFMMTFPGVISTSLAQSRLLH